MLINGKKSTLISVLDRGLCYGDGFFETFFCFQGLLQNWDYHWVRMKKTADKLKIVLPGESVFLSDFAQLKAYNEQISTNNVIKVIVTRGVGGRGYSPTYCKSTSRIIFSSDMPNYQTLRTQGMEVAILNSTLTAEGQLAGLKHLNRLSQVLAKMELDEKGGDEGVVCNEQGYVREGVSSNVFIVRNNVLITPPLNDCGVKGVLRNKIIDLAPVLCNLDVLEQDFFVSDLLAADEIFFTNSLLGVCPVKKISNHFYSTGKITQTLMNASLEKHN